METIQIDDKSKMKFEKLFIVEEKKYATLNKIHSDEFAPPSNEGPPIECVEKIRELPEEHVRQMFNSNFGIRYWNYYIGIPILRFMARFQQK